MFSHDKKPSERKNSGSTHEADQDALSFEACPLPENDPLFLHIMRDLKKETESLFSVQNIVKAQAKYVVNVSWECGLVGEPIPGRVVIFRYLYNCPVITVVKRTRNFYRKYGMVGTIQKILSKLPGRC